MKLIEALQKTLTEKAEKAPDGWKTLKQWAKEEGCSREYMQTIVAQLRDFGKVEMKKFPVKYPCMIRNVPHYRLKES